MSRTPSRNSDIYFVGLINPDQPQACIVAPGATIRVYLDQLPSDMPVHPYLLDGCLLGAATQVGPNGDAVLLHFRGWTVLSFWDTSGYTPERLKRSIPMDLTSSFIMRGTEPFAGAVRRSRAAFPAVWARFDFDVREISNERTKRKTRRLRVGDPYGSGVRSGYRTGDSVAVPPLVKWGVAEGKDALARHRAAKKAQSQQVKDKTEFSSREQTK